MPHRALDAPPLIRAAAEDDLVAITSIYAHYVRNDTASFEIEPPDLDAMSTRFRGIVDRGLPYFVAQASAADRTAVGYAYASTYRPRAGYRYTVEDSVYVAPQCAGRGIATALLTHVIDACEAHGYRQMLAVIGGADNHASIELHASLGFQHVGQLRSVGRKFDRWLDSILMQRALGRGSAAEID